MCHKSPRRHPLTVAIAVVCFLTSAVTLAQEAPLTSEALHIQAVAGEHSHSVSGLFTMYDK